MIFAYFVKDKRILKGFYLNSFFIYNLLALSSLIISLKLYNFPPLCYLIYKLNNVVFSGRFLCMLFR